MQHKTLRASFYTACQLFLLLVLLALGSAQAEESGDIIQVEKMRSLRKFVMMPIDPEGLPPGHGDAFQRELTQAFQKRFGSVKGFDLKALS